MEVTEDKISTSEQTKTSQTEVLLEKHEMEMETVNNELFFDVVQ
jgi:hypothetical protein